MTLALVFFFFNDTATTEIYPLSLHDALPISIHCGALPREVFESELFGHEKGAFTGAVAAKPGLVELADGGTRSEEHTSELQSQSNLVCRLLLEKKKEKKAQFATRIRPDVELI